MLSMHLEAECLLTLNQRSCIGIVLSAGQSNVAQIAQKRVRGV